MQEKFFLVKRDKDGFPRLFGYVQTADDGKEKAILVDLTDERITQFEKDGSYNGTGEFRRYCRVIRFTPLKKSKEEEGEKIAKF